jgi:thiol:disulfide interchange protein DsbD
MERLLPKFTSFAAILNMKSLRLKSKAFLVSFLPLLFVCFHSWGQIYDPVDWFFSAEDKGDGQFELEFKAKIEKGWHVYSLELPSDQGPLPTEFLFTESSDFSLEGKTREGEYVTEYDPNFQMDLNFFKDEAIFTQTISRNISEAFKVKGELSFMVCNEEMCLPPEYVEFAIDIPEGKKESSAGSSTKSSDSPFGGGTQLGSIPGTASKIYEPVDWTFEVIEETDTSAILLATATIEEGWHLYSPDQNPNEGPLPTEFHFENFDGFEIDEAIDYTKPKVEYEPVFDLEVAYFDNSAFFKKKIRKISGKAGKIEGFVSFMACQDELCIAPPTVDFSYSLKEGKPASEGIATSEPRESIGGKKSNRSNWGIFIISFLSGFAALLTPCVFPMIPMTVSFFTKQSKTRSAGIKNAIIYGLSIIGIYVFLGVAVTAVFGADVLSRMSTDPWFNLAFFVLLIVFAISFLGAFEITLPSSWINKADSKADKGGLIGIFFMAFTLALVSFSCTGPIVGTLIVEAATKGGTAPIIGMLGFSLAIALPFGLFAAFPGWMNTLPQSGGWLNSVKVVLGFLELALAFKFLSNADMVLQLHLLEREVFIAIWIVIFGLLTLYLLGKLKLPHDSDLKYISVTRLLLAVVTGMFTIYMIPGLWGAPLKLIAAFPPPMHYSESPQGVGFLGGGAVAHQEHSADQHLGPQGIFVYHDYDKGLAKAKELGIPAMLDFTGHACVNCRKMEQQVWSDPGIKSKLTDDVVLISLYVDEKVELPEEEKRTVDLGNGRKRKLRTVGDKWAAFQEIKYQVNAQPYYVLLDHDGEMLVEPANYQDYGDVDLFSDWLNRGILKFSEKNN